MVTICDHLPLFLGGEQERKIAGKALGIALDGLVQGLGGNGVQLRQISIQNDLVSTDAQDHLVQRGLFLEFSCEESVCFASSSVNVVMGS